MSKPGARPLSKSQPSTSVGRTSFKGLKRQKESISFRFEDLGLVVKAHDGGDLKVLKGVTGEIKSAELTAVMGPSGAGKTTFMVSWLWH